MGPSSRHQTTQKTSWGGKKTWITDNWRAKNSDNAATCALCIYNICRIYFHLFIVEQQFFAVAVDKRSASVGSLVGFDKRSLNSQLDGAFGSAFLLCPLINDFDICKKQQSCGASNCVKSLSDSLISSVENARRNEKNILIRIQMFCLLPQLIFNWWKMPLSMVKTITQ